VASAASLSAQALAFDIVGRNAILADPNWKGGDYYGTGQSPSPGLAQARMIGHITYLSPGIMAQKFGRGKAAGDEPGERFRTRFQVESYLEHQGMKFVDRFDANSYLHITEAIDTYDLAEEHGSLEKAFQPVRAKYLVVALSTDWLYPAEQSLEIAGALLRAGKNVSYCLLHAPYGHDAFLVDIEHLAEVVRTFLGSPLSAATQPPSAAGTACERIARMIKPGSRVLDLGCGDGDLLAVLSHGSRAVSLGVDIDLGHVIRVLSKGLNVFQRNIDENLGMIPDQSYDCAILSQTLQVLRRPRFVLHEMLRIAREGIVAFPNFANWANRLRLGFAGRMPKSQTLPFEWYDTPNIHLATLKDFLRLCETDRIRIVDMACMSEGVIGRALIGARLCNLGADSVMVKITRG
jgi:homoserine O-acetyltransferase